MFSMTTPEKTQGLLAGLAVFCLAVAVILIGVPSLEERIATRNEAILAARSAHVHPGELLDLLQQVGDDFHVLMLDVRSEADYESFHIAEAQHIATSEIVDTVLDDNLVKYFADTTAIIVMSNDETAATEAWRLLAANESLHVYILDGGVNNWLNVFANEALLEDFAVTDQQDDEPGYVFDSSMRSVAGKHLAADPDPADFDIEYEAAVTIGTEGGAEVEEVEPVDTGGCG